MIQRIEIQFVTKSDFSDTAFEFGNRKFNLTSIDSLIYILIVTPPVWI